ncbi:hypothetical protein GPECTOR_30g181 [Gonium pectorale]|uniref:SET domain-containing protein n=1 Tax=Gonium pectorale TaxID=33097 RepID=A0A150GE23_GONPE|nr:hypothetical protein GPECTOR_30g181 [Gonium pectorale]|eukprot:KXZ48086.1 hypothetical protein GPECTOR_30g181 [Gonium pectorale]
MVKLGGKHARTGGAAGQEGPSAAADAPAEAVAAGAQAFGSSKQQQQQAAVGPLAAPPVPPQHQPAASIAHLHGYVPPSVDLPPLQPGQVRVCGLTFDAALAPAVASAQAAWLAGLSRELRFADPTRDQLAPASAELDNRVSRNVVVSKLARLLGLAGDNGRPDAPLQEGPVVLEGAMQPCGDPTRGGAGLQAARGIRRNEVLGVVGGYVMPAADTAVFRSAGVRYSRPEVANRLAAAVEGTQADVETAWSLLAGSFRMQLPAGLALTPPGEGAPADPTELSMMGYGNLMALVNDPRVDPRDWTRCNDVDSQEAAGKANCAVVPVCVRGLVLPVLVALRDIAAGEQLLRDYGAGWWRDLADAWEVAEHDGLDVARLLRIEQSCANDEQPHAPQGFELDDPEDLDLAAGAAEAFMRFWQQQRQRHRGDSGGAGGGVSRRGDQGDR